MKEFNSICILFFYLIIFTILRIILDGAQDLSYLATSLKGSLIFIASLTYLIAFNTKDIYIKLLNVFFINASIALFVGTFQEFQPIVDIFKPNGGMELIGWTPYRNSFLSGSGYFGIGAPFAIAIVFFITSIFLNLKNNNIYKNTTHIVKLLTIIIAGIFAARTVFFCLAIAITYLVFIKRSLVTLIIGSILTIITISILNLEIFKDYQLWLFEIFDKGLGSSDSGSALFSTHIKLPDNIETILIGDGKYIDSITKGYYMSTDIGYLRHLYFGGIFFMISVLSIPFFMFMKNKNNIFLFVIIPVCLILHFKGVFIYNNPAFTPLLMIISHIYMQQRKKGI